MNATQKTITTLAFSTMLFGGVAMAQASFNYSEVHSNVQQLNVQLEESRKQRQGGLGGDKAISFQLYDVVEALNQRYNFGLDNFSLTIVTEGENIVITYFGLYPKNMGKFSSDVDYNAKIVVLPNDTATLTITDKKTHKDTVTNHTPIK